MTEEKLIEVFNKIYDALDDEQKAQAQACDTPEEFFAIADKAGVAVPDEFLDEISGGASVENQAMYNQSVNNKSVINQTTYNQSVQNAGAFNQSILNQAKITGNPTGQHTIMPLGSTSIGSPVKAQTVKQVWTLTKSTWGKTGMKA